MRPITIWDFLARWFFWWPLYRPLMRLAHRFNWHHMTICYIEDDIMDWCQWCGVRQVRPKLESS